MQYVLDHAYKNFTFYRNKTKEVGVRPENIRKLSDIEKLPFVTKEDLQRFSLEEVFIFKNYWGTKVQKQQKYIHM
ncbi:MAG: hypothetical protein N2V75_01850 [Methanophagales archaeon]|nr:hypothetical protein [Methanophagales archaeon]